MTRIVGLDLSLSSTGVALLDLTPGVLGPEAVRVGLHTVSSKPPAAPMGEKHPTLAQRSTRLRRLAGTVVDHCYGANLVVVEGPAFASSGAGTWDRAGLWWLVLARLTGAGLNVVEVPPSNVKTYALGKGNGAGTDKDRVLAAVVMRYQALVAVTGNDTADALVLAAMGARWAGQPIDDGLPQSHTRALKGVRWQPTVGR